jgi:hypothetical protein
MDTDDHDVLDELKRLCSEARVAPPGGERTPESGSGDADIVLIEGSPVYAEDGAVGIRVSERVTLHVRTADLISAERVAGPARYRLGMGANAIVSVTTTQFLPARLDRIHPGGTEGDTTGDEVSGPVALRFRPPWSRSQTFLTCLGSAAGSCQGAHGPLYDDQGFMNGDLIDCYVRAAEACDRLDRALPPG